MEMLPPNRNSSNAVIVRNHVLLPFFLSQGALPVGEGWGEEVTCAPRSPAALSVTSLLTLLSTAVRVSPGACSVRSPARRRLEKVSRCSGP